MVSAKDINYGLEKAIEELQQYLDVNLLWNDKSTEDDKFEVYGLINKNIKDDNIIPEAYLGTGKNQKEYGRIFVNDKVFATIGFLETGVRETIPFHSANIDIIFTVRIDKIYNTTTRDTEKALIEAEKTVISFGRIYDIQSIKLGIEEVFSGFDTDGIKYRDMHPWFVFSFNVDIPYDDNNIC